MCRELKRPHLLSRLHDARRTRARARGVIATGDGNGKGEKALPFSLAFSHYPPSSRRLGTSQGRECGWGGGVGLITCYRPLAISLKNNCIRALLSNV